MSDLRTVLERGVGGATPPPDGFERMLRRGDRKRRNQRIRAGVVGIVVFVAAIWIVTSGELVDHSQKPASTGSTVSPDAAEGVGLVGLPPQGATPSSPRRGELVFSFGFGHTMGDPGRFSVYVYADGRLIWQRLAGGTDEYATDYTTGLIEQRLTPEGVELLRAEVISTGLFDHDLHLNSSYGLTSGQIKVRNGDRLVGVTWGDCCHAGSEDVARTMPTPEQAGALKRLDARLADPASWLPATAWEDPEITAFVPSGYSVCYETHQGTGFNLVLASLPRPAEELIRTWDRERTHLELGRGQSLDIWCSQVAIDEARALARIFDDAGQERHEDVFGLRYVLGQRDPDAKEITVSFEALLPHDM
jgi:hypothetical protein